MPAFNLVKMINFNIPFHPFALCLARCSGNLQSLFPAPSLGAQINSFASWLFNFLKLLVSKIIISHFYKISLNGRWQAELRDAFVEIAFLNYI